MHTLLGYPSARELIADIVKAAALALACYAMWHALDTIALAVRLARLAAGA